MLKTLLPLLFLLIVHTVSAQQARQYSFMRFSTSNGLAANIVRAVTQDQDGFIWIATSNGLQRYDGNSFVQFKNSPGDSTTIPSDILYLLFNDSKNNLWIAGANNKLGVFDTKHFRFREVKIEGKEDKEPYYTTKAFLESHNRVYLYEPNGAIFFYDPGKNLFVSARRHIPNPPNWNRTSIAEEQGKRKFWITSDSGIAVYNANTKNLNYKSHNPDREPVVEAIGNMQHVLGVLPGIGRNLYLNIWPANSGSPRLYQVDKSTAAARIFDLGLELGIGYHEIGGIFQQRNGRMWVYGKSFFAEITSGEKPFKNIPNAYTSEQSIKFDVIYNIFEDEAGNLWIATDNGLFNFNPGAQIFNVYNLLRPGSKSSFEAPVQSLLELEDGSMLVGCWGAGLYYFDKQMNPLTLPAALQANMNFLSIWDMHRHSKTGKVWMVMQGGGIIVYDPKTKTKTEQKPEIFQNRTIRQVEEDQDGNLWFGHQGGRIVKWDYKESGGDVFKALKLVETSGGTYKLYCDKQGFVWAGTMTRGLLKIDSRTMRVVKTYTMNGPEGERLYNNDPTDIVQYNDTTLIVTAGALNLINLKTGKVSFFSTANGLPANNTRCLQVDDLGVVWIGMENGLCRINFQKRVVTNYDRRDGIAYDNFGPAGCVKLSGGRLGFVTDHNFMIFDPAHLVPATRPATPSFSTFKLGGKTLLPDSVLFNSKLELDYDNPTFEIEFSSLNFIHQYKLHYFYMLEGLDYDWLPVEGQNKVHYNYLAPGNYTFRVKAVDADGKESGIREVKIHVNPPFWKTWWFLGLCLLTVLVILFYFDRERMKRLRAIQQTRASIAGNLHEDIHTTLNNINILSEMAKMKADKDINRSKEYIQQISEKSHNMIIAMDDMLWSIDPGNDSLEQTRQRTREFIDALQSRHEAKIDLQVDKKVLALKMDMRMRHEYFLAVKMILRLIVEDAQSKETQVNVDVAKSKLILKVKSESATLNIKHPAIIEKIDAIKKRVAGIKAILDVQVDFTGTSIILLVPL